MEIEAVLVRCYFGTEGAQRPDSHFEVCPERQGRDDRSEVELSGSASGHNSRSVLWAGV